MKIKIIAVGKTDDHYLQEGIEKYIQRLQHYTVIEKIIVPAVKSKGKLSVSVQKDQEAALISKHIAEKDILVLLDEKGKQYTSTLFSGFIQKRLNAGQPLAFVIGGPFGFASALYEKANFKLSLSEMTFSHQMIRLFFVEQLYRAFTILRGEKYHHM